MLVQHRFDLSGIHVEAGADDQLLGAADDVENVAVEPCEVAGVEPAIGVDHCRSPFGVPVIAAHHIGTTDVQLADLARRHGAVVGPDQTRIDPRYQRAYSIVASRQLRLDGCDRGGAFGNAIGVAQWETEFCLDLGF